MTLQQKKNVKTNSSSVVIYAYNYPLKSCRVAEQKNNTRIKSFNKAVRRGELHVAVETHRNPVKLPRRTETQLTEFPSYTLNAISFREVFTS